MRRASRPDLAPDVVVAVDAANRVDDLRRERTSVAEARASLGRLVARRTAGDVEQLPRRRWNARDRDDGPTASWTDGDMRTRLRLEVREGEATLRLDHGNGDSSLEPRSVEVGLCGIDPNGIAALVPDPASAGSPWTVLATAEASLARLLRSPSSEPPPDVAAALRALAREAHADLGLPGFRALRIHAASPWSPVSLSIDAPGGASTFPPAGDGDVRSHRPDGRGIPTVVRLFHSGGRRDGSANVVLDPWSTVVDPDRDDPVQTLRDATALAYLRSRA